MPRYLRKPMVIDAVQYVEHGKLVKGMCNSKFCYLAGNDKPHVHTIHGNQVVNLEVGDFIVPEPDGAHYYPVKPEIFAASYDPYVPPRCIRCDAELSPEEVKSKCAACGEIMPTVHGSDPLDDQA